jgi:hypothetical protein
VAGLGKDPRAEATSSPESAKAAARQLDPMAVFVALLRNQSFVTEGEIHQALLSKAQ